MKENTRLLPIPLLRRLHSLLLLEGKDGVGKGRNQICGGSEGPASAYLLHGCAHLLQGRLPPLGLLSQGLAYPFFLCQFLLLALKTTWQDVVQNTPRVTSLTCMLSPVT